mmetsp:Transcript_30558/g.72086  ORF Transcript_30558/g.72086 Transcript_30558/m.72086 type:complete len:291 (+) Transcript_30558:214-1086(+)
MTAIKIVRELLPWDFTRDAPRSKRRKSSSSACYGIETGGRDQQENNHRENGIACAVTPSSLVSRALADHGLPDRIDPFSIEFMMEFDYHDGCLQRGINAEVLVAIQSDNIDMLTRHCFNRERLVNLQNSQGETLLHLACRWGSVAILKYLLRDIQMSVLVLDRQGRSPLHSLCLSMNTTSTVHYATASNVNHLESMRLLLREKASLILYKDKQGKVPLEYLQQSGSTTKFHTVVNDMLSSERIVDRAVEEMSHRMEQSRSGRQLSAMEKLSSLLDFSGIEAAIMETGLSI